MAWTLLQLKDLVANALGANTGSTPTTIRDNCINQARRVFYSERQWSFLFKTASVSLTTQVGNLPTDYNKKFQPLGVYYYIGSVKYEYHQVSWQDVAMYDQSQYAYAIDLDAGTIYVNTTSPASVTLDYTYLPTDKVMDGTQDSNSEPAPDINPIGQLAIAKWWLASERATAKYQLFKGEYESALGGAILADNMTKGVTSIYPRSRRIRTGYFGRGS